ncbi:hypothetical protein C8F01DRAFT_758927 [Mycena amicta]|nr:hypothetical protein C8F01DRAFT_758927 [Mycena amicta]
MGRTFLNIKVRLGCHQCDWPSRTRMFFVLPLFCSVRDAMKAWHHDHLSGHPSSCPSPSRQSSRRVCRRTLPGLRMSTRPATTASKRPRRCHVIASHGSRIPTSAFRNSRMGYEALPSLPVTSSDPYTRRHFSAGVYPPLSRTPWPPIPVQPLRAVPPRLSCAGVAISQRCTIRPSCAGPGPLSRIECPAADDGLEVPSSSLECVSFRSVRIHPLLPVDASPQPHCLVVILRDHRVPRHLARADTFIQST